MIGAAIAFCAFAAPVAPVDAAPASACSSQSGVTVIVDFTAFGGNIERGCDPGQPATALAAMQTAGFSTAGTARYGDAFVCRIDGLPSPKKEACTDTPPASSSWSFYFARPNAKAWTYSAAGVSSYQPPAGSLIAFAFGNYAKPGVLPSGATPTITTTTTAPRRTTVPPPRPTVTGAATPATPATTTPPVVAPTATAPDTVVPSTTVTRSTHASTSTSTRLEPSTTNGPRIVDKASGPVPDTGSSGSPWPAIVTVALVAALGGGAFALIRARRRRAA
jgi:LPXTG-motif cell wall-anchored protein